MRIETYLSGPLQVNCYFVYEEESKKGYIVDPGGYNQGLYESAKKKNIEIEYMILTHGHSDHMGGISNYRLLYPKIKLIAPEKDREFLKNEELNCSLDILGAAITVEADHYVKDGETLNIGNMELTFLETPGHTPGGMCIYTQNVLFSGDTLFCTSIGRTDFPGGSYEQIVESIHKKLFILPENTVVLPGHMGETTIKKEKESNPFV